MAYFQSLHSMFSFYIGKHKYLFHISTAPRKFLQPRRTTFWGSSYDPDRWEALLFLCSKNEIRGWFDWVLKKFPNKEFWRNDKILQHGGYVTLYVHIVKVNVKDLFIPETRYGKEFVIKKALRPRKIVPVRYYPYKRTDLSGISTALKYLKKHTK